MCNSCMACVIGTLVLNLHNMQKRATKSDTLGHCLIIPENMALINTGREKFQLKINEF